MATPTISIALLEYFAPVFLLIFVFAIMYALFQWAKILGDNKVLHAIISFIAALFVAIYSKGASAMVRYMIPWFTMLAIFMVLAIMLYKIFGASDDDIRSVIKNRTDIQWTLFIIILIIILGALSQAYGQSQLAITTDTGNSTGQSGSNVGVINAGNPGTSGTGSGSFNTNLGATFYNPRVLGMLFILIISALSIAMLSSTVKKA
jgi:hypothetical protein